MDETEEGRSPLDSDSPVAWEELLEAMGPAALLVIVEDRMSHALRARIRPEDILQDALLLVWRDRMKIEWRGLLAFRSFFLSVLDNRIRDAADRENALKRGGASGVPVLSELASASGDGNASGPAIGAVSTTPSRIASHREQADVMREALEALPEELREVVRLRLLEEVPTQDVADRLGLGLSATKHRFLKGARLYHEHLRVALATRSQRIERER